jgi:hypothetical protein
LLSRRGERQENCSKGSQRMRKLLQCSEVGRGHDCCLEGERQENCSKIRQRMCNLMQCSVVGGGQDCCLEGERQEYCSNYSNAVQLQKAIIAVRGTLRELFKSTQMSTYINNNLMRD